MKKTAIVVILLFIFLFPPITIAQPAPPDVPTLGPVHIISAGDNYKKVTITSPLNQTNYSNELKLIISIEAVGMFGQFGNVGYSLDGGTINSIRNIAKSVDDKTGYPDWYYYKTTAGASLLLTNLFDGFHTITVYYGWQYAQSFDVSAYSTVDFTIGNADATPEIYIKSPSNLSFTQNNSTLLSFYLRHVNNMAKNASIYYSLDGKNYSVSNTNGVGVKTMINNVTPFNQEIANLSDGLHFLTVYAQIYILNSWSFEGNSSIQFTVDTSPPTITELSIVNKTYSNQNITLSFNLNENTSWIAYNLDNQGITTLQGNTTLTGLPFGSHNIVVYANDTLGNMRKSDTIFFEVKKIDYNPVIALSGIIVVIVTVIGVGLWVYFKKRKTKTVKSRNLD